MAIDLDNLTPDSDESATSVNSAELGLATRNASVEDVYDHFTKLVYVIDVSASMGDKLLDLNTVEDFNWNDAALKRLAKRIERAKDRISKVEEEQAWDLDSDEEEDAEEVTDDLDPQAGENPLNDLFWLAISELPLEQQKAQVVATADAWAELRLDLSASARKIDYDAVPSKMDAVKQMAAKMVQERVEKFPDADIHLITFEDSAHYVKPAGIPDLLRRISEMCAYGGGTDITTAVEKALAVCKKNPSPVQSHHIVLVTDGLDYGLERLGQHQLEMKRLNLVLDVIHVSSPHESSLAEYGGGSLKTVCQRSGGKYVRVMRRSDFENRFLEAARRLCLPAPSQG